MPKEPVIVTGNELAIAEGKRYYRGVYIFLAAAGLFAIFAAFVIYHLVVAHFSDFELVVFVGVGAILVFASIGCVFSAGDFSARSRYEPKIYQLLEESDGLTKKFNEYKDACNIGLARLGEGHMKLLLFVKERSPALLEEFNIWKAKQKRDDSSPDTMDE